MDAISIDQFYLARCGLLLNIFYRSHFSLSLPLGGGGYSKLRLLLDFPREAPRTHCQLLGRLLDTGVRHLVGNRRSPRDPPAPVVAILWGSFLFGSTSFMFRLVYCEINTNER